MVDLHLAGVWKSDIGFGPVLTCWWTLGFRSLQIAVGIYQVFGASLCPQASREPEPLLPAVAGDVKPDSKAAYNNNNKTLSVPWSDKTYKTHGISSLKVQFLTLPVSSRTEV